MSDDQIIVPGDALMNNEFLQHLEQVPEDVLQRMAFSMPWQLNPSQDDVDPDGFGSPVMSLNKDYSQYTYKELQDECWRKFNRNPHVRSTITDSMGRIGGYGFDICSEIWEVEEVIQEIMFDYRNRLWLFLPKFIARSEIEGELFLVLTVHDDGFIEVDFRDPSTLSGGPDNKGVYVHPTKPTMPIAYEFMTNGGKSAGFGKEIIPSIYTARLPELLKKIKGQANFNESLLNGSRTTNKKFSSIGGFNKFVVSWDKSFLTTRNTSHIVTVLEWVNHYETLKKYEIDHKKSSGAFVWAFKMEDMKTLKLWMSLSERERAMTGITAKKTPGSSIILPPGIDLIAVNPNLTSISDTDTDILSMVITGLNKPEDVVTGQSKGTYAAVKASRGPLADRTHDEIAYFERFFKHEFWSAIFFLKNKVAGFPDHFKEEIATKFDKNKKPIFKKVKRRPEFFIEITFPTSEIENMESLTKAMLGTKHGNIARTLGIPNERIAKRLGFDSYRKMRLEHAKEEEYYPELEPEVDQESAQEIENEPTKSGVKKKPKKVE